MSAFFAGHSRRSCFLWVIVFFLVLEVMLFADLPGGSAIAAFDPYLDAGKTLRDTASASGYKCYTGCDNQAYDDNT